MVDNERCKATEFLNPTLRLASTNPLIRTGLGRSLARLHPFPNFTPSQHEGGLRPFFCGFRPLHRFWFDVDEEPTTEWLFQ